MEDKFKKRTTCEYCGKPMEAKNRNKRFCTDKCRTYFRRDSKLIFTKPQVKAVADTFVKKTAEMVKPVQLLTEIEKLEEELSKLTEKGQYADKMRKILTAKINKLK